MNFPFFLTPVCFQMPTSHLAKKSGETPYSIQRNLLLFVNPMGVGLRSNAESPREIVGAWTAVGMKSLVLEVLVWKIVLISVCIPFSRCIPLLELQKLSVQILLYIKYRFRPV